MSYEQDANQQASQLTKIPAPMFPNRGGSASGMVGGAAPAPSAAITAPMVANHLQELVGRTYALREALEQRVLQLTGTDPRSPEVPNGHKEPELLGFLPNLARDIEQLERNLNACGRAVDLLGSRL